MTTSTTELSDADIVARLHSLLTEIDKADRVQGNLVTGVLAAAIHFAAGDPEFGGMPHEEVYRTTYGLLFGPGARYRDDSGGYETTAVRSVRHLAGRIVAQTVADDLAAHPLFTHRYPMREAVEQIIGGTWEQRGGPGSACLTLHREATAWSEELREAGLFKTVQTLAAATNGSSPQALFRHLCMHYSTTYDHGRGRALGAALHRIINLSRWSPDHAARFGYARKPRQEAS
ncbi:hypothetical protein [Kitasatospora aureofaciens]|uniref:hypothetical protein n=1 Tax=Kitasatospora aureofaciens TaxID=1894 RepID=UPI000525A9F6|nr:hypothetical protein [Kitasatospora aureofaciens]